MSATVYEYRDATELPHYAYMLPVIRQILSEHAFPEKRAFEIGCGNGYVANILSHQGFDVIGIDPSPSAIEVAKRHFPQLSFYTGSSDDDLPRAYGVFPFVYSLETIAHVVKPREFARRVYDLLDPKGVAVVSTPFHGYWKNLAISLLGRWDRHLHTLDEAKYLSLFSENTFLRLWRDAGFQNVRIIRVGRASAFAKAMIAVLQRS